jgi:hypothetical protein
VRLGREPQRHRQRHSHELDHGTHQERDEVVEQPRGVRHAEHILDGAEHADDHAEHDVVDDERGGRRSDLDHVIHDDVAEPHDHHFDDDQDEHGDDHEDDHRDDHENGHGTAHDDNADPHGHDVADDGDHDVEHAAGHEHDDHEHHDRYEPPSGSRGSRRRRGDEGRGIVR